jgi:hypothetical protein
VILEHHKGNITHVIATHDPNIVISAGAEKDIR